MVHKNLKEVRQHGNLSLPISCYRIQPPFENYDQLECHWHKEMELFKVVRGTMDIQCGSDYFGLKAGEMAFINSGELHAGRQTDGADMDYAAVVFSPEMLCGDQDDIVRVKYVAPVMDGRRSVQRVIGMETEREQAVQRGFDELMRLLQDGGPGYELLVRAKLLEVFAALAGEGENCRAEREKAPSQGIKNAIDYIRENYKNPLTIDELAGVGHMSAGHFCRLFKKYTFKTPVQYINGVRLSAAMDMLLRTDRKVLDIAFDAGFNSLSYFIGVFKESLGCTPTEFRRSGGSAVRGPADQGPEAL